MSAQEPSVYESQKIAQVPSFYESNKIVALQIDTIDRVPADLPDEAKVFVRTVELEMKSLLMRVSGDVSRGVVLDGGQMNAAAQLAHQLKDKLIQAAVLGAEAKKRAAPSEAGGAAKRPTRE